MGLSLRLLERLKRGRLSLFLALFGLKLRQEQADSLGQRLPKHTG